MKDKNYLDDIKEKSLNDLIQLADNTIKNLENKKDLENSIDDYQKLITINNLIQKRFQSKSKEITEDTKIKIKKILKNEKQFK
tara:strand:+ start:3750 stop:3998 length:249 start_codon:yes stop_codon:yes gene_type:complete